MFRSTCRTVLPGIALVSASAALAQDDSEAWALSGGFDLLELRQGEGEAALTWDATFSLGNATDQLMLATTGGGALDSQIDEIELRLFYGRTIEGVALLAGVRQTVSRGSRDTYTALGAQGTIGTRLEWETYAFLSHQGDLIGEAQVIYTIPIMDHLYLEPRVTIGWSAQSMDEEATRPGLTEGEGTLRLRYSLNDTINLYTGVMHERLLSGTWRLAMEQGEAAQSTMAVAGIGINF